MGIITRIASAVLGRTAQKVNLNIMGGAFYGLMDNMDDYIKKGYQLNADVYSITSFIASKASEAPFSLYKIKNEKAFYKYKSLMSNPTAESLKIAETLRYKAMDEVANHELLDILNKSPNPNITGKEFRYAMVLYRLITGNTYVYGMSPSTAINKFKELYILPSQDVTPIANGIWQDVEGYRLDFLPDRTLSKEEVCHMKYFNPQFTSTNPFVVGQSPLQAAAKIIESSNAGVEAESNSFKNGGKYGLLTVDTDQPITEEQRQYLQSHIDMKMKSNADYSKIIATNSKMIFQKIGDSPVDMAVIESGLNGMRKLCNVFHVSSILFNDNAGSTFNNLKESRKAALTDAIIPELSSIKDSFNQWLLKGWGMDGYYLDFDLSVYPELSEDMGQVADLMAKSWWLTPNEKRVSMNYDTITDTEMDKVFIPSGFSEIGMIDITALGNQADAGLKNLGL